MAAYPPLEKRKEWWFVFYPCKPYVWKGICFFINWSWPVHNVHILQHSGVIQISLENLKKTKSMRKEMTDGTGAVEARFRWVVLYMFRRCMLKMRSSGSCDALSEITTQKVPEELTLWGHRACSTQEQVRAGTQRRCESAGRWGQSWQTGRGLPLGLQTPEDSFPSPVPSVPPVQSWLVFKDPSFVSVCFLQGLLCKKSSLFEYL